MATSCSRIASYVNAKSSAVTGSPSLQRIPSRRPKDVDTAVGRDRDLLREVGDDVEPAVEAQGAAKEVGPEAPATMS